MTKKDEEFLQALQLIYERFVSADDNEKAINVELKTTDGIIQDILHYIEFLPLSASDGYKKSYDLKEARISRRILKEKFEIQSSITEYAKNNKNFILSLKKFITGISDIKEAQRKRMYAYRTNIYGDKEKIEHKEIVYKK